MQPLWIKDTGAGSGSSLDFSPGIDGGNEKAIEKSRFLGHN
jgi:hypothetical protein